MSGYETNAQALASAALSKTSGLSDRITAIEQRLDKIEDVRETTLWKPTGELRWYLEVGRSDSDLRLEQLFERISGERQWRPVPKMMEIMEE